MALTQLQRVVFQEFENSSGQNLAWIVHTSPEEIGQICKEKLRELNIPLSWFRSYESQFLDHILI